MPQNPLVPRQGGSNSKLNLSATTVVRSTGGGTLYRVSVLTAGSAPGGVYDNNSTSSGNVAAAKIGVIPNTVGIYKFEWPVQVGIVYVLGTGQVVSISYA